MKKTDLLVIVGQTASGKTDLACYLAKRLSGEIICADSRTVYKGLEIGTAKPSLAQTKAIPHHLLDVADLGQNFNVAHFKSLAQAALTEIRDRGNLPIIVGGSGLYVESLVYDLSLPPGQYLRDQLNDLSVEQLQARLKDQGLALPQNAKNKRYLIRALERGNQVGQRQPLAPNTRLIGLKLPKERLLVKIRARAQAMIEAGVIEETRQVLSYPQTEAAKGNIYRALNPYLKGEIDLQAALEDFVVRDWRLARRQVAYFKRWPVEWFSSAKKAASAILGE